MFKTKLKKALGVSIVAATCLLTALPASAAPASDAKSNNYTVKSFHYLTVDGKDVSSPGQVNNKSNNIKVTMVLPKQDKNGDLLAYGFTSNVTLEAFIAKDKQRLQNKFQPTASDPCCTFFYEDQNKGGQYFYWRYGYTNLPSEWINRISSISTASPSYSYSTTLWEHTSTQGYGSGVLLRHSDWYGKTVNMASDWDNKISAIEIK
ncbi:hypothetical protein [Bacillus mojavensis]|uniref:hypothetical protein n=1 Tax=Bacillus mojavensis TaxID=72360 RepID=UPI002DBC4C5F|nr:hypothetical protein [Bacillus mojavensis]MEC1615468.1 hypothetical protein [Bacillus mojavensis]MEC1621662.1 hypothetical protein [Bacillus mojavensis]MEC1661639.1 hypothetical protein [Bacillus mojavensis]MEC1685401.1 hypothetical protein [Bacillus mojavensis]MEC1689949.1 hypothetical protein [Bacillus mojavensis]